MSGRKPRKAGSSKRSTGKPEVRLGRKKQVLGHGGIRRRRPPQRHPIGAEHSDLPGERLQKVLAAAGVASRREAEELILEGRVEVDGQVVTELGTRVDRHTQEIFVDGDALPRPKLLYFAVNKPEGVVCTARDPAGRPRITDLLPPDVGRVFNVGRLDLASEGLILMTNDGELANGLTHPRHGVPKTYEVQVAGDLPPEVLKQLREGVYLAEGFVRPVEVKIKKHKHRTTILEMVLDEGRNREIRRLLARVGHKVQRLTRIAVGPIRLGELPPGAFRPLTAQEVKKLRDAVVECTHNRSKPPVSKPGTASTRRGAQNAAKTKAIGTRPSKRAQATGRSGKTARGAAGTPRKRGKR